MSYNQDDIINVLNFLKQTPEANLRKMLCGGELSDSHFRILMKLAKGGPETDFIDAFNNEGMAKLRLSTKEIPLKEHFWRITKSKLLALGLLTKAAQAA